MKQTYTVLAAVIAMVGTACAAPPSVRESSGDVEMGSAAAGNASWGGNFRGVEGWRDTRGSVYARPTATGTQIALTITGGIAGSRYGWEVREGKCGSDGRIVGEAASYTPVPLGDQGMGSSVTDITIKMDQGKEYFVNVYGSETDRTMVIACGALRR